MKAITQVQGKGMAGVQSHSNFRLAKVAAKKSASFGMPGGGNILVQAKGAHHTYIPMYDWDDCNCDSNHTCDTHNQ